MKRFLYLVVLIFALIPRAFADELKLYGIISYLANDQSELRIDDLVVRLEGAHIEGFLNLGALIEVEGYWQEDTFIATELEVKRSTQPDVFIFRGQVIGGKLLGLEFPELSETDWLELTTKRAKDMSLTLLLVKHLNAAESAVQATVDALSEGGFMAGGVSIISERSVAVGDLISISGIWKDGVLIDTP